MPQASRKIDRKPTNAKLRGDPGHPDFLLADSPFYLIVRTAGRYAMDMENALRSVGIDLPSWRALMLLHETNPSSVSEIAERAVTRLSTMTRVVQRLEKRGLAKLAARASDARVTEVFITTAGERLVTQIRAVASGIYHRAFHDLTAGEIETLKVTLSHIFRNLAIQPHELMSPSQPRVRKARKPHQPGS